MSAAPTSTTIARPASSARAADPFLHAKEPGRREMRRLSLATRSLYPFVLSWFARVPQQDRGALRVLDMPAGSGILSAPLAAAGFDVTPADLFPEYLDNASRQYANQSTIDAFESETESTMPLWLRTRLFDDGKTDPPRPAALAATSADMEATLPFPDASFDLIACVEGIEHVVDRHRTLRELRRVLKPGGRMLITTPNLLSIRARLAYAFAGQRAFKSYIDEYTSVWGRSDDGERIYHGHAFLINYFQLRYSLHHCGFRIGGLWPSNWSPSSLLLAPLTPLIWLGTARSQRKARRKFDRMKRAGDVDPETTAPFDEMRRHLLSSAMLFNATLMIEAVACPSPAHDRAG